MRCSRWLVCLAGLAIAWSGSCHGAAPQARRLQSSPEVSEVKPQSKVTLSEDLEAELAQIGADPQDAIGSGEKAYMPYEMRAGAGLMRSVEPEITQRLLSEAKDTRRPLAYRLAMVHLIALREDAEVDPALIAALDAPELRGTAAYGLGRMGFKGYPRRARDQGMVLRALREHTRDTFTFRDPWLRVMLRNQDLVLAACARVAGIESLALGPGVDVDFLGYELPAFSDEVRAALLAHCESDTGG